MSTASAAHHSPLPSPEERPEADVMIYDGQCRFCSGQVERIARWDSRGRLSFLSLHDPRVAERYPDLTHEQLMQQMYVVDSRGNRHAGAAAFRYITRKVPRLWPLVPLLHLPFSLPLWQFLYRHFARIRYRFGKVEECDGSCPIHFS